MLEVIKETKWLSLDVSSSKVVFAKLSLAVRALQPTRLIIMNCFCSQVRTVYMLYVCLGFVRACGKFSDF